MANTFKLPSDRDLAAKVIEGEHGHRTKLTEMGWFGRCIGGGTEKAGNVAWFAICASFIFLAVMLGVGDDPEIKKQGMTLFGGIITGALGFLFGRSTKE